MVKVSGVRSCGGAVRSRLANIDPHRVGGAVTGRESLRSEHANKTTQQHLDRLDLTRRTLLEIAEPHGPSRDTR